MGEGIGGLVFDARTMDYIEFKFGEADKSTCQSASFISKVQGSFLLFVICSDCESCPFEICAYHYHGPDY